MKRWIFILMLLTAAAMFVAWIACSIIFEENGVYNLLLPGSLLVALAIVFLMPNKK